MSFRLLLTSTLLSLLLSSGLQAALPREVRRELTRMTKEARGVARLIRTDKINDAKALIEQLEQRAGELNIADDEKDRAWTGFQRQLQRARLAFPVSFEADIAPILTASCLDCHGEDQQSGQLRLDTFQALRQGGRSGALLQPGSPRNSLIMMRLTSNNDEQRMPRNAETLPDDQIQLIGRWIAARARFDGSDENAPIGQSAKMKVSVAQDDGTGTVSFTKDVAPLLVTFCLRCHSGNSPRGGLSMVTVADLLRGGDSGDTIVPGDADSSYLWQLVWKQDPLKMPQGQARLKRSQARTLQTWINEGARFDGDDASAPIRQLVPTAAEQSASRLNAMSDEQFQTRRTQQATDLWKRVAPGQEPTTVTTDNFYACGNVTDERLQQLTAQAEDQLANIRQTWGDDTAPWRGRLILFVTADRFEYSEFNTVLRDQRTPDQLHGHVVITAQQDTAYLVLHDFGDATSNRKLSSTQWLNALVAEAWIARQGTTLPDWLQRGFGLAAAGLNPADLRRTRSQVLPLLRSLESPEALFGNNSFPPAEAALVGAHLTAFLQTQGRDRFLQFVDALNSGSSPAEAAQQTWNQPLNAIAAAFVRSLQK